jgi:preprotein translocase subunit SecG
MRSNRRSQQPAVLSGTPGNRGLTAPLLTDEELRREEISSRQHQYRQQDLERGSDGTNIRLLYAAHNEEDFQREMEEEREREIIETANKVRMVNEVFTDVNNLVAEQQSGVDQISDHVSDATQKTKSGVKQIDKSIGHQRGLNKCYLYCLVLFIVIAIALAIAIFHKDIANMFMSDDDDDDDDDDDEVGAIEYSTISERVAKATVAGSSRRLLRGAFR